MVDYKFEFKKVFYLIKDGNFEIKVPKLPEEFIYKNGVYLWIYQNKVRKVGIFGEGIKSTSNTRFAMYRTVGKNLWKYIQNILKSNGSVKPLKTLTEKLEVGEQVEVQFVKLPSEGKYINGLPYRLDLYELEEYFKNQHKESLWLS